MEDREVWRLNLELLPRNSHGKAGNEERRRSLVLNFDKSVLQCHWNKTVCLGKVSFHRFSEGEFFLTKAICFLGDCFGLETDVS